MLFRGFCHALDGILVSITQGHHPRQALMLLGLLVVSAASPVHGDRYALLVGIDEYDLSYGAGSLSSCVNDANGIRNCLLADASRWKSANITRLLNSSATRTAIRNSLTTRATAAVSGDMVLYFQSSHGGQDDGTSAYLCSYNADYKDTELAADLARFKDGVTVIVVIDACYSGGMFKGDGGSGAVKHSWDFAQSVMRHYDAIRKERSAKGASIGWMTACDFDELSSSGICYSLFAGNMIYGLVHGDASANGVLTFQELFDYAAPRTLLVDPTQAPQTINGGVLAATECAAVVPFDANVANAVDTSLPVHAKPGPSALWTRQTATSHDGADAARSGTVAHGQGSEFGIRVVGPGTLTFWWRVSSEPYYDLLSLHVDDLLIDETSGSASWVQRTHPIGPGAHLLRWTYQKDESFTEGSDCGWVDQVTWTPDSGTLSNPLADALDAPTLTVFTGGNQVWTRQTAVAHDGVDAAQSGTGIDGLSSWFTTTLTGPGSLSFWWRVSSEAGFDVLDFSVDDKTEARISGAVSWQQETWALASGTHTVGWRYTKDISLSELSDRGWVDQVVWVPHHVDETPVFSNITVHAGAQAVLAWCSITNHRYTIQCSTNLVSGFWVLSSNITANPPLNCYTDAMDNGRQKFWKITVEPR